MLKFYYYPLSVNARRVWIALLEKQLPFELVLVDLSGDQFEPEFTVLNPLQRIPVIVDQGFRVVESLAILDYLEAKYPMPALMPTNPEAIATVRMVEMAAVTDLQPATMLLTRPLVGLAVDDQKLEWARQRVVAVMQLYETLLADQVYFVGDRLTLADIVAGTLVASLSLFGVTFDAYPRIRRWLDRLELRESWQQTTPLPTAIEAALPSIRKILERRW